MFSKSQTEQFASYFAELNRRYIGRCVEPNSPWRNPDVPKPKVKSKARAKPVRTKKAAKVPAVKPAPNPEPEVEVKTPKKPEFSEYDIYTLMLNETGALTSAEIKIITDAGIT